MTRTLALVVVVLVLGLAVFGYWDANRPTAGAPDAAVVAASPVPQPPVVDVPAAAPATDAGPISPPAPMPPNSTLINADPVTGRGAEVNLAWISACLSQGYDIEIAKDKEFTWMVFSSYADSGGGVYEPADSENPRMIIPPGAQFKGTYATGPISLEAGHTYWYRVRTAVATTGQVIHSPWSTPVPFTFKAG